VPKRIEDNKKNAEGACWGRKPNMGIVVQLGQNPGQDQNQGIPELAEKVAGACRNRLLEPKAVAVSFNHISEQLGTDPRLILKAVTWLESQGRVEVRSFRLRSRPHVSIPAVCRIDDLNLCPPADD
jgi:hypothetical protein